MAVSRTNMEVFPPSVKTRKQWDLKWVTIGLAVVIVSFFALVPLGFILYQSFMTPQTATQVYRDAEI